MHCLLSFFTYETTCANIYTFLKALGHPVANEEPAHTLKILFFNAAYAVQSLQVSIHSAEVVVCYEPDADLDVLLSFYSDEKQKNARESFGSSPWDEDQKAYFSDCLNNAIEKLGALCPELLQTLFMHLFKIYLFPHKKLISMSNANMWGIIIIVPREDKLETLSYPEQFFEGIVHEGLHQFLLLDALVTPYFTRPEQADEIQISGSLTLRPIPLEIALHACIIANVQAQLYLKDNSLTRAKALLCNYFTALAHLVATVNASAAEGQPLLTPRGQQWLDALQQTPWPQEILNLQPLMQA